MIKASPILHMQIIFQHNMALGFKMLRDKKFCVQCIFHAGADASAGNYSERRDFACPHPKHSRYLVKKHILACEEHKNDSNNLMKCVKYLLYDPKLVHQLSSGMVLFKSPFQDATCQCPTTGRMFLSLGKEPPSLASSIQPKRDIENFHFKHHL